jgi:hypothetical protein
MAYEYNFPDHIKGDTFNGVQFEVLVNTIALNLTGASIKMQMRYTPTSVSVKEFNTTSGITITDATAGKFKINKQIIDIAFKKYFYDIEITLQTGEVYTYIKGTWNILADITHLG